MASLFQHLRVLLWKNWLSVRRQPLWSLTLIAWPAITFILVAIIRLSFPPEAQPNCYLAPRNLPSAGFFPFLQTVLCNSDAVCKATPYTPEDLLPKLNSLSPIRRKRRRSADAERERRLLPQGADITKSRNGSLELIDSIANLKSSIENVSLSSHNRTQFRNILSLGKMPLQKSAVANLKAGICDILSAYAASQNPLWEAMGANVYQSFCFTELSLVESFFHEFKSQISKLQDDPQYQVAFVRETVSFLSLLSELQNESSVWRLLLLAPDITRGVIHVKGMVAALQNTSRTFMDPEKDFLPDVRDPGLKARLLDSLNCTEQDENSSELTDLCELTRPWKGNQTLFAQVKDIVSKIISPDMASTDLKMENFSRNLELILKSLHRFNNVQESNSTTELENLKPFNLFDNKTVLRLTEILSRQTRGDHHTKLRDIFRWKDILEGHSLASLLLKAGFNTSSLSQMMAHFKEIRNLYNIARNIWDLAFLKTDFKATKLWQTMKMITSHKFLYMPEKVRRYITAMQEVSSVVADSLLKPITMENFPEKILALQKIFDIVANVNTSHNYLLISSLSDMMQQIQNSINDYQWNEFNTYWHIVEKLRSAKWNDTDIVAYGQFLDIIHKNLYIHRNGSGLLLDKEMEQLIAFVNHLLEDYSGEGGISGGNVSMVLDTIVKTLHVLEDLEEKYISALITSNPLMNADGHNETIQRLLEIFREGVGILSDPRLLETSSIKKMDDLFNFSRLLDLQDLRRTPVRQDASVEREVLELWYLTLSPFVREDIKDNERLLNCTVKDFHRIAIDVLFSNTTLNEALARSNCRFLFTFMNAANRTVSNNQTFTEAFQLVLRNLKSLPTFDALQKSKYVPDEFQCFIKSLELSSGFLSKLDTFINYKNPWIQKMHKSLKTISSKLTQSNLACQVPLFGNMAVINESLAFRILIPFLINDTESYSQHLSVSQSVPEQALASFMSLLNDPERNTSITKMLENRGKAVRHPQWKNLSALLSKFATVLNTTQNVTDAPLLEIIRKVLILVGTALPPNSTETHPFFEILNWGVNASYFENIFDSLNLFNVTSETDYRTSLERYFNTWSPSVDAQSIFHLNPQWEDTKKALNLTRVIWNNLFLNETSFSLAAIWAAVKKVVSGGIPLPPVDTRHDLPSAQETSLQVSNFLLKSIATKNILGQILSAQNVYNITANVSMNENYPFIVQLSEIMQRIQNTTAEPRWNELSDLGHEQLRSMRRNSSNPDAYGHLFKTLHNHLITQHNVSGLHFSLDLFNTLLSHVLQKDAEENLQNNKILEALNTVLRNPFFEENSEHRFDISQLERLMNESNKALQRIYGTLKGGTVILLDRRLEGASDKERIAALYDFSRFLFPRVFNQSLLGQRASSDAKVADLLHLSLSPFLDVRNQRGKPQSCSVKDILHIILQVLLQNATLHDSFKQSDCEILLTSRDFVNRTKPNQTLAELFHFSIRNLKLSPESANLYKNEAISSTLLCIIRSLQFSANVLSKMDILFNFKNPWIQQTYKSLAAVSKALPSNDSSCLIPVLDGVNDVIDYYPSDIVSPFLAHGTDFHSQNFTDWLVAGDHLLAFFKLLENRTHQYSATNEALEMAKDASSHSGAKSFLQIWNLIVKRNLTEMEYPKHGSKSMEKVVFHNESNPVLEASIYILKKVVLSDLLKKLKTDQDPNFHSNKPNMEYIFEHITYPFIMVTEMLSSENLLQKELGKTSSPNTLIAQFLFSEFENTFLKTLPNDGLRSYLFCLMNMADGPDGELPGDAPVPLNTEELEKVFFTHHDTFQKYSSVPEILMFRLSRLQNLTSALCDSERLRRAQQVCHLPDVSFVDLCRQSKFHKKLLHSVALSGQLVASLVNHRSVPGELREILLGDPTKLRQEMNWFRQHVPQLHYIQDIPQYVASVNSLVNHTRTASHSKKQDTVIDLFRNVEQLKEDLRHVVEMSTESIDALLQMPLPENRTEFVFEMLQLEACQNGGAADPKLEVITKEFCTLPLPERARKSYVLGITLLRYLDVYNFMYKMLFPRELQSSLDKVFGLLQDLDHFKNRVESDVRPLLDAIHSLKKLRQSRNAPLSKALFKASNLTMDRGTFKTISKSLCNQDITPLFFESLLPDFEEQNIHHSSTEDEGVKHIMQKYGIPQDSTPFCLSFYLDLVRTPTGALIWSFLKPMLLGKILYTPDTPETRAIMRKSNSTLKVMADLAYKSQEWLENSPLILNSLTTLNQTIPVLKNTLRNPFVQVFIKLMVKLDALDLLSQINHLDDIRLELQNNADIINQLDTLSALTVNVSSCVLFDRIKPARSVDELEMLAKQLFLKNELFASIIFRLPSNSPGGDGTSRRRLSLPPLLNYTIRMSSKISQTTKRIREKIWTVGPHNSASQSQIYSRAFVYIQDSLERAIIELQTGKRLEDIAVQVQGTPYPCYSKDMFLTSVTYSLPFTLMAAWVLFIAAFVKKLVQEKDLRLYEYMKMMGVNSSSHFFAWFLECASFLLITVTFLILILKVGNILPQSNVVILFLYLTDYSFSIIAMCYLISVFFNNTNIAALVGSLVYILTFFPFIVLLVVENHVSFSVKSLLSLLSPTAFSYASQYIARYEEQGIGLQWHNVYKSPMTGDNTNFGWMCWLILIDSFIYFILGWYIRNVFPGKYGMAAPWYFPLLPSYWAERYGYIPLWNGKSKGLPFTGFFWRKEPAFPEKMYVQNALPSNLEPEPSNLTVGVSLHGITKIYGSKAAVQNLNLNFYEGNITSLLGHNGAGKTTTISILTGLFPASSGTIFVYGKDIRTDQDIIRKNMGICMQHNVLFSYLTTKEHLLLYGYIKVPHWSQQELQEEVERTLKDTGLYSHRHKLAGSLSGGMKRKLSISIALLGGSRVVILDEPTTGVDPCSRRGIWEIISKNRKGRTIILSTHHLDEAEVLSDRIAFLENGGLKCCGSPFYLKETFGSGYHLTLTKKKSPTLKVAEECDTTVVTAMIQSHLPAAYLKEDIGGELVYVLPPFNSRVSSAYQSLLKSLDSGASDLQIGCYGISDSTVEEVFLNLTKDLSKAEQVDLEMPQEVPGYTLENDEMSMNSDSFTERDDQALVKSKKPNPLHLSLRKAGALFVKRFHHTRRNVKGFIAQVILPVLFVTAAMGLGTLRTEVAEYPALHLSPSLYGDSGQADFFGNYNKSTEPLVASLLAFPGVDNTCLNRSNPGCYKEEEPGEWRFSGNQSAQYSACNCTDDKQTCPKVDFVPPHKRTFSSRAVYNLTGHDVEAYLLTTAKEFVQKRYGGWSFGMPLTSDLQFDINPVPPNRTLTKVWYNPEGYHSLPAYLNSLNNFLLRANLPKEKSSTYGISVVAHPYPGGESQEQLMLSSLLDIIVSMSVLIGYSITTASFVLYVVKEHQNKAKQLQHISGLGVTSYWVTNFLYDLVYFLVPVALSIGVISAFQIPAFFNGNNLLAVFLLLFLFGYATFSWMYLLAGIFKETGMAFIVYVCINLFFGINTIITHSVVFLLSQEKATDQGLHDLAETLRHVFLMFPQFCFGNGLIELSQHQALMGFLKAYGVVYPDRTFELDRISSKLLGLFLQGTLFFSLRLLVDDGTIQKVWYKILEFLYDKVHGKLPLQLEAAEEEEDKDVFAESERVAAGRTEYDMLQLQNLTKIYHLPHRRIVAVRNVSVGIPAGECFGLLGVNGAGKTTIFKMLTGDIGPSRGRLLVRDENGSLDDVGSAHWSLFGYCPQEDALDDLLTVEEHMYYYARLHGIPEKQIKGIVLQLLYRLNLVPYRQRITSMCSYGTNRKLSTALALLGKPSVLLLDEPSSGMDPNAKRHLWKIISEEVQNQCSVILTSHSMEECEALCTRLAIMVNGHFRCLGSLQHIKSRFGKGFTVKMHLNNGADSIEKLTQFMQLSFPNTHLKDHQLNMVEYHVPVSAGGVANIFQLLEASKGVFKIRHFSVSQTTLEEVFINFAKHQTGPDASEAGSEDSDLSGPNPPTDALF